MREIVVLKSGGRRECFDRAKLGRAVALACRKRAIARERIDRLVAGVQRRISESGSGEVSTQAIGEMVMEALRDLDPVAYIRYASLQQAFSDPRDFERCASALRAARHP